MAPNEEEHQPPTSIARKRRAIDEMIEAAKEQALREYSLACARGEVEDYQRTMFDVRSKWDRLRGDVVVRERELQEATQRVAEKRKRLEEITGAPPPPTEGWM